MTQPVKYFFESLLALLGLSFYIQWFIWRDNIRIKKEIEEMKQSFMVSLDRFDITERGSIKEYTKEKLEIKKTEQVGKVWNPSKDQEVIAQGSLVDPFD